MLSERPFYGREFIRGMSGKLLFGYPRFSGGEGCGATFLGTFFVVEKSTSPAGARPREQLIEKTIAIYRFPPEACGNDWNIDVPE